MGVLKFEIGGGLEPENGRGVVPNLDSRFGKTEATDANRRHLVPDSVFSSLCAADDMRAGNMIAATAAIRRNVSELQRTCRIESSLMMKMRCCNQAERSRYRTSTQLKARNQVPFRLEDDRRAPDGSGPTGLIQHAVCSVTPCCLWHRPK